VIEVPGTVVLLSLLLTTARMRTEAVIVLESNGNGVREWRLRCKRVMVKVPGTAVLVIPLFFSTAGEGTEEKGAMLIRQDRRTDSQTNRQIDRQIDR
jgi:hypothetical protein